MVANGPVPKGRKGLRLRPTRDAESGTIGAEAMMASRVKTPVREFAELSVEYPDQWILMTVSRHNWSTGRIWGRLLFASSDRDAITEPAIVYRKQNPGAEIAILFSGPLFDPNFDGMLAL